ncbi:MULTISPECIES: hypothetical protein [unclassified Streptomyces]|uniref:hypothetical protein n=1 Tax=unclassified Streptomyces TaxID=2593676 RepID=UPI0035E1B34A
MSDSSGRAPENAAAPDHLDRLLARHAPGIAPRPGVVRVRPRLAEPFERVEAVRSGAPETREALWPTAPHGPADRDEPPRSPASRDIHSRTERELTVVRTSPVTPPAPPVSHATERKAPTAPLLRPAATPTPRTGSAPEAGRRAEHARADVPESRRAALLPVPPHTNTASATGSAPLRPSAADTAAARDAVRQATGRRSGRGTEQVVHVQIGRLEVTAAPSRPGEDRGRTPTQRRAAATVSLEEYLVRGRE